MSSTEFVLWKGYLTKLPNEFDPLYHYLAALRADIVRGYVKHPGRVHAKNMLLEFPMEGEDEELTDEQREAKMKQSKSAWLAVTGSASQRKGR